MTAEQSRRLHELAAQVAAMRRAQKDYFRTRSGASLDLSRVLERRVDHTIEEILAPPSDLFEIGSPPLALVRDDEDPAQFVPFRASTCPDCQAPIGLLAVGGEDVPCDGLGVEHDGSGLAALFHECPAAPGDDALSPPDWGG